VAVAVLSASAAQATAESIVVSAQPVPLSVDESATPSTGALRYRGGLVLRSEHRFGGLSGLRVSDDGGRLEAVSDEGQWFTARLLYDDGRLAGLTDAEIGPLRDPDGKSLAEKTWQDAESLTVLPDGSRLVGFEHHHRILRYSQGLAATPELVPTPPELEKAPLNESLESLATLRGGGFLALTEDFKEDGMVRGWLVREGRWSKFLYRLDGDPRPSDATTLPNGDLLVLERSFSPLRGLLLRLRRVAEKCLVADAKLTPKTIAELRLPLTIDNFEGVSARRNEKGETIIYLISDDNFSPLQRTLLMMYALED